MLAAAIFIEGVGTIVRNIRDGKKCGKQIIAVAAALVISTLGTVAYLLINYNVSGDFFVFMEYEKLNWDQQLGLFLIPCDTFGTGASTQFRTGTSA